MQRYQLEAILVNPGSFSLVPYYGDLVEASMVSRPLSYRLRDLGANEHGIRISFVDQLGAAFQDIFEILGRSSDGVDQDGVGGADDRGEMRVPGLINVNTASSTVLEAVHAYLAENTGARAKDVAAAIKPFVNGSGVLGVGTVSGFGSDGADQAGSVGGISDDLEESQMIWSRFANLTTTRSDTFAAYVLIEMLDRDGEVQDRGRWVLLLDRSECYEPPLEWNGTDGEWQDNPRYRRPKVVFRQRME